MLPQLNKKAKNAKNAVGPIPTAFLKPHRQHFVLPPPLLKKWRHNSVDYIWRVSGALSTVCIFIFTLKMYYDIIIKQNKQGDRYDRES